MIQKIQEFVATGRRKTAVARVRLAHGVGKIIVNGQDAEEYFPATMDMGLVTKPFTVTDTEKQFDVIAKVHGGGKFGQAGALRHGISRALVLSNDSLKPALKSAGCMTRDSRMKERKKTGQPGARKRFQFSKR